MHAILYTGQTWGVERNPGALTGKKTILKLCADDKI